ncbi:ABC transporter permease [Natronomonas amylolytica]|uniref:ABC transporter permease n=1 Tax=Natronomonas amylolytica TaxID=3108498 RepID=UPI00300AFC73
MNDVNAFLAVVRREITTMARTRAYAVLTVLLAGVLLGIVERSDAVAGGYVPSAVDLLLPMEVLVPVIAIALGYRAFSGDNDDTAVLKTYPVSNASLVAGVFFGRLVGLAAVVGLPLLSVMALVALTPGIDSAVFATTGGIDSPILFVRFVALTVLFGAAVLGVTLAASILARSSRAALALAVGIFVAVVVGGDLLVLGGLAAGSIPEDGLDVALALSPNSAYRGLVFEHVVGVAAEREGFIDPRSSAVMLLAWTAFGLVAATVGLSRRGESSLLSRVRWKLEELR